MDFQDNNKPIYLQIADRVCDGIFSGEYSEEERIPSVREYAALVQVNANTVMRSFMHLSALGIIYNQRGKGFYVAHDAKNKIERMRAESFFNEELKAVFDRLSSMRISPDKLRGLYEEYLCTGLMAEAKTNDNITDNPVE